MLCLCILFFRNRSEPHLIILFVPSFCQYQLKSADSRSLSLRSSSLQNAWPLQPSLCPSTKGVNASAPHVASGICWRSLQQPPAADTPAWGKTIVGLAKAVIGRGHQQELFEFEHWGDENLGWHLVPSMDWPHHNACSHPEAAGHLVKKIWGPFQKMLIVDLVCLLCGRKSCSHQVKQMRLDLCLPPNPAFVHCDSHGLKGLLSFIVHRLHASKRRREPGWE